MPTFKRKAILKLVPKVDDEFRSLIPPLSAEETRQLEANLIAEGCRDALVLWRGLLLDGHNRLALCNRHGIPYETAEIDLPDREAANLWIEEHQLGRRNLSSDQRAAVAYRIMQRRVAISRKQRAAKAGASRGSDRNLVVHGATEIGSRQRERTAKEQNISTRKLREIGALAKTDPAIVTSIINGEISLRDAKEAMLDRVRQRKITAALETHVRGEGIHTGRMNQLFRLLDDDNVSLFITDPPPCEKKVALRQYTELGRLAQQKLRPGGFCLVTCEQLYLDEIIACLSENLEWHWLCAVKLNSDENGGRIWPRKITTRFKPLLMFTKRPAPKQAENGWVADFVHRPETDKARQEHGHSDSQYYIERLTLSGELCVDPFVGDGTVPVICKALGRRFVGTELDPGSAASARARVASSPVLREHGSAPISHQRLIRNRVAEQEAASPPADAWESLDRSIENAVVREISIPEAKKIIEKYEWLGTMPAIVFHCFGIFFDDVCGGVAVYGVEYAENLGVWDKYGYTGKIICLARGACVHWAHPHSASKLIRTSMRMLPEKYKVVTCTVDATAGEIGTIYQACGFSFVGIATGSNRASIVGPDGKHLSERQAYDLYGTRSIKALQSMGHTVVSVPRKGRYFAFRGSKREKKELRKQIEHLIKPYPKRDLPAVIV